jgi:ribosomal protein S6 kinase beta
MHVCSDQVLAYVSHLAERWHCMQVYLVKARRTQELYAMKVLNKQRVIQKEQVAYAMGERNVMSKLDHPYLVTLRYAFQTNHRLFLVMDYVEGGHLWTHMKAGFLAEGVARIFAAEIVLALLHLHGLGIAHRDLKPENILLDSDNHCRLTDFGLAKRDLDEDSRAHTMVGTIDYMAPEVRCSWPTAYNLKP